MSGESPPELAEALLTATGLTVAAGRGDAGAADLLASLRPWWHRDGLIAVTSGAAFIDVMGNEGDAEKAGAIYDEVVAAVSGLWHRHDFQARVRLGALLLGQLASAAAHAGVAERGALTHRGDELASVSLEVAAQSRPGRRRGPESEAWISRVRAERARLHWLSGIDPLPEEALVDVWRRTVAAFERFGHVYETARSRARLAAVLKATGAAAEAEGEISLAHEMAESLGAEPLVKELRALGGLDRAQPRPAAGRRDVPLTAREAEVLALIAEGRSNREIGLQLFISAKTVSVHVSNILAKLDAAGRTEAVALARRRGLLTGSTVDEGR